MYTNTPITDGDEDEKEGSSRTVGEDYDPLDVIMVGPVKIPTSSDLYPLF